MGQRGPKPTPTPVLKLRGSELAKEPKRKNEVKAAGVCRCPKWLKGEGKRKFNQLKKILVERGVLDALDSEALGRYCDTWILWRRMRDDMDIGGMTHTVATKSGATIQPRPCVKLANIYADQLKKLEAEFGMTPSARVGLPATKPKSSAAGKARFFQSA